MALVALSPFLGSIPNGGEVPNDNFPWRIVGIGLRNSALVTAGTVVITLVLAVPAAYALARIEFRLRGALFLLVLFALAIPGAVLLLPQYQEIAWLGLMNSDLGLVLLYAAANLPLAVFFLRPAFASVPAELVEAMRADGVSPLGLVHRLFLPLATSALVAITVLVIAQAWGELQLATIFITSPSRYTLPIFMKIGIGSSATIGASWLAIAPPLLAFLLAQRAFRRGALSGVVAVDAAPPARAAKEGLIHPGG